MVRGDDGEDMVVSVRGPAPLTGLEAEMMGELVRAALRWLRREHGGDDPGWH